MVDIVAYQSTPNAIRYIDLGKTESILISDEDKDGSNDSIYFYFGSGEMILVNGRSDGFYHLLDDVTAWIEERMKP